MRVETKRTCSKCFWPPAMPAPSWLDLDEAAFKASRLHQNAVIRSLEIIGEAAGKVSPATQAARPEIPWREITGMRHRLIHGYAEVRLDLVWMVAQERLGPLIAALEPLISEEGRRLMNAKRLLKRNERIATKPMGESLGMSPAYPSRPRHHRDPPRARPLSRL